MPVLRPALLCGLLWAGLLLCKSLSGPECLPLCGSSDIERRRRDNMNEINELLLQLEHRSKKWTCFPSLKREKFLSYDYFFVLKWLCNYKLNPSPKLGFGCDYYVWMNQWKHVWVLYPYNIRASSNSRPRFIEQGSLWIFQKATECLMIFALSFDR